MTEPSATSDSGLGKGSTLGALIRARALVERGWAQRYAHLRRDGVDHFCLVGAIRAAVEDLAGKRIRIPTSEATFDDRRVLLDWNDARGRTHAQAVHVLDVAIERERARRAA